MATIYSGHLQLTRRRLQDKFWLPAFMMKNVSKYMKRTRKLELILNVEYGEVVL